MAEISLEAIDPGAIGAGIVYHDDLDQSIFDGDELRLDVRIAMLRTAFEFYRFLDIPGLVVKDIIFTGSLAAFNYTKYSDCDVHLIVDYDKSVCPTLADNFFSTKKSLWGETRDVEIKGYPVELYVEDTKNPVTAAAVYSLISGDWLRKPAHNIPSWDDQAVFAKTDALADQIDDLVDAKAGSEAYGKLMDRIRRMRRAGLAKGGEFSTENLAFKALRNLGYLDRLYQAKIRAQDADLSIE